MGSTELLLAVVATSLLTGAVASAKGYSFAAFAGLGALLLLLALAIAALLPSRRNPPA